MFYSALSAWRLALQDKSFRIKIIISVGVLLLCGWVAPITFHYVQHREGKLLQDFVLAWLPSVDLSIWIFTLLYFLILISVLALLTDPPKLLITLQAYILLTLLRFNTMIFFPLEPPVDIIVLEDPFVKYFFYQEIITKDLFFSGHTSILVLLGLAVPFKRLRLIVLVGAAAVGVMLLVQHAHYTIDVLAAPIFAWGLFTFVKAFSKSD